MDDELSWEETICGECKYLRMFYDKHDWEVFRCGNEEGRGTDDPEKDACKCFVKGEE